jgi:hypothetical protein
MYVHEEQWKGLSLQSKNLLNAIIHSFEEQYAFTYKVYRKKLLKWLEIGLSYPLLRWDRSLFRKLSLIFAWETALIIFAKQKNL